MKFLVIFAAAILQLVCGQEQRFIPQITEGAYQNYSGRALVNLGDHYYFFETAIPSSWTDAKTFCRGLNMFLVSVETLEENTLIVDYITSTAGVGHYWISGNDVGRERGDWVWDSTGDRVIFSDFHEGEPSLDRSENYLQYWHQFGQLKWNDVANDAEPVFAICEQL